MFQTLNSSKPDPELVQAQLQRVVQSAAFARSARMKRFLTFIVEAAIESEWEDPPNLKESVIAVSVFDRDAAYDPKLDPIVRVEARRLRAKLQEYYDGPGKTDPIRICLPMGGYTPQFEIVEVPQPPESPAAPDADPFLQAQPQEAASLPAPAARASDAVGRRFSPAALSIALMVFAVLSVSFLLRPRTPETSPVTSIVTPVPFTSKEGIEATPFFSPDGSQVVYAARDNEASRFQLVIQETKSGAERTLIKSAADDISPIWSPDGRWIAFLRKGPDGLADLMLIASNGSGVERKIGTGTVNTPFQRGLAWSPDSKWIAFTEEQEHDQRHSLNLVSIEGHGFKRLTNPPPGGADWEHAFASSGRLLSFTRDLGGGVNTVHLLRLDDKYNPQGEPWRPAWQDFSTALSYSSAWTADGKDLLFVANLGGPHRLWRAPAAGGRPAVLGWAGRSITGLAVSEKGRLLYSAETDDSNIWRVDLTQSKSGQAPQPEAVIHTTRMDANPQVSPDGRFIAYESDQGGHIDVWIADTVSGTSRQLTHFESVVTGSPRWSPDGKNIAFDSRRDGNPEIYVVRADGGEARRLTNSPAIDTLPVWAADGNSIYFTSNRSGTFEIWSVRLTVGDPERITQGGGYAPQVSPDGAAVYYLKERSPQSSLWRLSSSGSTPELVEKAVLNRRFAVTADSVVFMEPCQTRKFCVTSLAKSGRDRRTTIATLRDAVLHGVSVSADGRRLYFAQLDRAGSDIMLAEAF